jgi:hypothetical protein
MNQVKGNVEDPKLDALPSPSGISLHVTRSPRPGDDTGFFEITVSPDLPQTISSVETSTQKHLS